MDKTAAVVRMVLACSRCGTRLPAAGVDDASWQLAQGPAEASAHDCPDLPVHDVLYRVAWMQDREAAVKRNAHVHQVSQAANMGAEFTGRYRHEISEDLKTCTTTLAPPPEPTPDPSRMGTMTHEARLKLWDKGIEKDPEALKGLPARDDHAPLMQMLEPFSRGKEWTPEYSPESERSVAGQAVAAAVLRFPWVRVAEVAEDEDGVFIQYEVSGVRCDRCDTKEFVWGPDDRYDPKVAEEMINFLSRKTDRLVVTNYFGERFVWTWPKRRDLNLPVTQGIWTDGSDE